MYMELSKNFKDFYVTKQIIKNLLEIIKCVYKYFILDSGEKSVGKQVHRAARHLQVHLSPPIRLGDSVHVGVLAACWQQRQVGLQ